VEQVIGVGAAVSGDMLSRPNYGLDELDFVFSTLIVGSLMNFALMYLLAPTVGAGPSNPIMKFVTGETLAKMSAPTGHMFEKGSFSLLQRATTFVYKSVQFGVIGFLAGITGTLCSNGLIAVRQKSDPNFVLQNELPETIPNAGCWALHMAISSNVRYQTVNGIDMVVFPLMNRGVFKAYSTAIRLGNNVLGGMSFATIARFFGVQGQKSAPKECCSGKGKGKGKK